MLDFMVYRLKPYGADLVVDSDISDGDSLILAAYQASVLEIGV